MCDVFFHIRFNGDQFWFLGYDNGIYIGLKANGYAGIYDTGSSSNSNFNLGWTQDTWHHLAVVRDGGVTRMYLDGTQKGSFTNTETI